MNKGEDLCVETESVNRAVLIAMTVFAVAYYGAALGGEVDTDLVRAAGFEVELDEGINWAISR